MAAAEAMQENGVNMSDTKAKDRKISNVKGWLIALVVFGHFIEINRGAYNELFDLIYLFHMPMFIFMSGYLAKRASLQKMLTFLVYYALFQVFFILVKALLGMSSFAIDFAVPQFHLWYLVSLTVWYACAVLFLRLHVRGRAVLACLAGIAAVSLLSRWLTADVVQAVSNVYADFSSYSLSYQRTLSFAIFFFAGFFMTKQWFERIGQMISSYALRIGVLMVISMGVFWVSQSQGQLVRLLKGSFGSDAFLASDASFMKYLFVVGAYYVVSMAMCVVVLNLVTRQQSIFTKWGDNSLQIFLFHPVFLFWLQTMQFYDEWSSMTRLLFYFWAALLVTALTGSAWFAKITNRYIFKPIPKLLLG